VKAAAADFTHNLRFPGQIFDPETGLCNNGFRDYSPALGRYVESDPIGLAGGVNTYAYAGNNPVSFADPFGLSADPVADAAGLTSNFIAGFTFAVSPNMGQSLALLNAAVTSTSTSGQFAFGSGALTGVVASNAAMFLLSIGDYILDKVAPKKVSGYRVTGRILGLRVAIHRMSVDHCGQSWTSPCNILWLRVTQLCI